MACPSRNPSRPLTDNQRRQLVALYMAGAFSKEAGIEAARLPQAPATANPLIIGALRDKGLAQSRSRRDPNRSWTEYWLTDAGRLLAGDIVRGRGPARAVKLDAGVTSIRAVLAGENGACVLVTTPGTQTLWTADQADAFAAELVSKAADARLAAAPQAGAA